MGSLPRVGFSLLQVLLLLGALGVLSCLAIPAWFSRPQITLENAARLLARDLRWAQDRAVFRGEEVIVDLDPAGDGYRVFNQERELLPAPLGPGGFVRRYAIDAVFQGVQLLSEDREVRYDRRGTVKHGDVELVLRFEGARRVVRVEAPTGRIVIEGLSEPWVDTAFAAGD